MLTTPLLERLAKRGAVDVVATAASAPLLANHPAVRDVIVYDKRGLHSGLLGMAKISKVLRYREVNGIKVARNAQVAYMAQGSLRSAFIARLAAIPSVVGFNSSGGRPLYTKRIPFNPALHHSARLLSLADISVSSASDLRPTLYPSEQDEATVRELLKQSGVSQSNKVVALAPGSVWATKRWPYYSDLAAKLSEQLRDGISIVLIGGPGDRDMCDNISRAVSDTGTTTVVNLAGRLSLLQTAALIRGASVVVTNDSAPLHLASAMNTPTVALFGPTVPALGFGPLATISSIIERSGMECRPCSAHGPKQCPLGHWKCMREIDAASVTSAALLGVGLDRG